MNLPYDLDLAIGYVCLLAVLSFTAFWLVPLAARAIVAALRELASLLRARISRGGPAGGALAERADEHWWGPHSPSH
ncbi:MAG: hypothetical protein RLZZ450_3799 [Pseudomonadota bacterium]|jgi:hypothetical protein